MGNRKRGRMRWRTREQYSERQRLDLHEPVADGEGSSNSLTHAICDPMSGEPIGIDVVIEKLKQERTLNENQNISYIGSGKFAVITILKSGKRRFAIDEVIEYEVDGRKAEWRGELLRKSNMPYTPNPAPLSSLYTTEEQQNMPKF